MLWLADLLEVNHQLESRVREIRLPGSEGGALHPASLPLSHPVEGRSPQRYDPAQTPKNGIRQKRLSIFPSRGEMCS
jgi:hypothetical protein